ncbi:unnamed protein product, partial [Closterium sp. NIES-53]
GGGGSGGGGGGGGPGGGASVAAVEAVEAVAEAVEAAAAVVEVAEEVVLVAVQPRSMEALVAASVSSSCAPVRPRLFSSFVSGTRSGEVCGLPHTTQRCFGRLTDAWRTQFPDAVELPRWHDLLLQNVPIFDLDFDAILAAMYALADITEGDCYLRVPPDPGIVAAAQGASAAAALGASASAAPGAGTSPLSGTAPTKSFHTFTLDSGASRSFFRDSTTLTPLRQPVAVSLADPLGGPVLAHSSTVLPCPAAPSGLLSELHLPSFSTNLVSGADLQDAWVDQFTPGGQRVTHCTCSRTGRHLATFTRRPGSSLYTLTTTPPLVSASSQVATSSQMFAAASRSSPASAPCSCRPLAHETLLWHHRLGHPSLPCLRGMASRALVSGLPRSLPPLPPGPAPTCVPCVEGRQRAAPHSSSFPPTEAPLQTLHMDVWAPARVRGQGHERYFLLVVDDYSLEDLVTHLRTSDACYRITLLAEFLDRNPPPMYITLYFIVTRLPDSLRAAPLVALLTRTSLRDVPPPSLPPPMPGGTGAGGSGAEGAGAGDTGAIGTGARGTGAGAGAGGAVSGGTGSGGTVRPRPFFVPLIRQVISLPSSTGLRPSLLSPPPRPSQPQLQPDSPLPAPSPYAEQTDSFTERCEPESCRASPVRAVCTGRRVPRPRPPPVPDTHAIALRPSSVPLCVPLPPPPESSLPVVPDPEFDHARTVSPSVSRLLTIIVTDPSFESIAASALVAELVDFAATCRLDYATALAAESEQEDFEGLAAAVPPFSSMLLAPEGDPDAPDIPTPRSYAKAITGSYSSQWLAAMDAEMASWKSTGTYVDAVPLSGANIVDGMWILRVKLSPGSLPAFKARYVARGFRLRQGVDYFHTFSPTPKMTTLRVLLHVAAQRDYELHSLDFITAFLHGSLHEEIKLRRPPGFTRSFLARLHLRHTSLPPFYVLVYVDDLVFATTDTEITRDRARGTITLTQSHMVHQILLCFRFQFSSPQPTPLTTGHSLLAPPSDEFVEPSGPYPELMGCLMYLMTCTQTDLAFPLSLVARYVAPSRQRKVHCDAAKRILRYLSSTSGMVLPAPRAAQKSIATSTGTVTGTGST